MTLNGKKCFHCGLPILGRCYYVVIDSVSEPMCCVGCQSVAESIIALGLAQYYQFREGSAVSQRELIPYELLEYEQFNQDNIQATYLIGDQKDNKKRIILSIDGITCAACIWLIEKYLKNIHGIVHVDVNMSNHRAELMWDNNVITLSSILQSISKIGFRAEPYEVERDDALKQQAQRQALKSLAVAGLGFGQVMMFSAPIYDWVSNGIAPAFRDFFRIVSLIVTTPVLIYCGKPFFKSAWLSLKTKTLTMDVSISLALLSVYIAGLYAIITRSGDVYFDSITMILFFVTLSRYLEMKACYYANNVTQKLTRQQPIWVTRVNGSIRETVLINSLVVGDIIIVKSGMVVPVDGVIIEGESSVNESLLTGEVSPRMVTVSSHVVAGSLNNDNPILLKVTQVGEKTTLAAILRLIERAQFEKPAIVSIAQRFSHYFILIQLILSFILFMYWAPFSIEHALWIMISMLVISCPCALALATPVAITSAMNALSGVGFLCAKGHVIESLSGITDVVFDKTGTLTYGNFIIINTQLFNDTDESYALQIAASLESQSEHPIAYAFKNMAPILDCVNTKVFPNQGIRGNINGKDYFIGSMAFIKKNIATDLAESNVSATEIVLADSTNILAIFTLKDKVRSDAADLMFYLREKKIALHLLSGDQDMPVADCADTLGIARFQSRCSPDAKLIYVKSLQQQGKKVLMLGDGINDAPVLMQADVSVAMSNAADLARVNADAILMKPYLSILIDVFDHAKKTKTIILQGLCWALLYNVIAIPFAIHGNVPPYIAAGLMSISSILVVTNALRLLKIRWLNSKILIPEFG